MSEKTYQILITITGIATLLFATALFATVGMRIELVATVASIIFILGLGILGALFARHLKVANEECEKQHSTID